MATQEGNYFAALPARLPPGFLPSIRQSSPQGLRWLHPGDLHLTLAFFGTFHRERVPEILKLLADIPFEEISITLGSMILLPQTRRFTSLSFEIRNGHSEIAHLISRWRNPLLQTAACQPDNRPPLPHLTVARPLKRDPHFNARSTIRWSEKLKPPAVPIPLAPPTLLGWVPDYHQAVREGAVRYCPVQ